MCVLVYKIVYGMCPNYLLNQIELVQYDNVINTRQKGNIYVERCKTNEEQKMLLHDGFKLYNSLPIEIKNELRLQSFRRMLVQHIKRREREEGMYNS